MWNKWVMVTVLAFSATVSAQELVVNGDFSTTDATGWNAFGGNAVTNTDNSGGALPLLAPGDTAYANYAGKLWGAWGGAWGASGFSQTLAVTAGTEYTATAKGLVLSNDAITSTAFGLMKLVWLNASDQVLFADGTVDASGNFGLESAQLNSSTTTDIWHDLSIVGTAPVGAVSAEALFLFLQPSGDGGGAAFFDNASSDGPDIPVINSPDYDHSLTVDWLDFTKLAGVWGQVSSDYNLSGDNFIGLEDLRLFAGAWLTSITPYPGYELLWSDEFYGSEINSSNWTHETGTGPNSDGWGNWEWQYYTDRSENSRIENGKLVIEARRENYEGRGYTSARLTTQGKQSFQYGKIEARIKLPAGGRGIWPAFWMLGDNITTAHWPACGELDIMEMIWDPYEVLGTIHFGSSSPYDHQDHGGSRSIGVDLSADFHVYGVEWESDTIRFYMDGVNYFTTTDAIWWSNVGSALAPFDQPFFILLNFAYGAWWADPEDPNVTFPQQLEIDYVRVYQKTTP